MAVATFETYSYCFEQVEKACDAIERGEATEASFMLRSVQDDAKILQKQSKKYHEGLKSLETKQRDKIESLTEKINDLHEEELKCSKQEREFDIQQKSLRKAKEIEQESYRKAQTRYREAQRERDTQLREKREKDEHFKKWWWVPGYSLYLAIDAMIAENEKKARDASREMECYQERSNDSEREMDRLSREVNKVKAELQASIKKQQQLNEQRDTCHKKIGTTKKLSVLLLEATQFWDDIASLSDSASLKSGRLEKVMHTATRRQNTIKILRSSGTKTLVGSFKDSWREIEDMIRSNDLIIAEEDCPAEALLGIQGFLESGQNRVANVNVNVNVLVLDSIAVILVVLALYGWYDVFGGVYSIIYNLIVAFPCWIVNKVLLILWVIYAIIYYLIIVFPCWIVKKVFLILWVIFSILYYILTFKVVQIGLVVAAIFGAFHVIRNR